MWEEGKVLKKNSSEPRFFFFFFQTWKSENLKYAENLKNDVFDFFFTVFFSCLWITNIGKKYLCFVSNFLTSVKPTMSKKKSKKRNNEIILCKICYDYYIDLDENDRIKKSKRSIRTLAGPGRHIQTMNANESEHNKLLKCWMQSTVRLSVLQCWFSHFYGMHAWSVYKLFSVSCKDKRYKYEDGDTGEVCVGIGGAAMGWIAFSRWLWMYLMVKQRDRLMSVQLVQNMVHV